MVAGLAMRRNVVLRGFGSLTEQSFAGTTMWRLDLRSKGLLADRRHLDDYQLHLPGYERFSARPTWQSEAR